jgi:hypothetical protein
MLKPLASKPAATMQEMRVGRISFIKVSLRIGR